MLSSTREAGRGSEEGTGQWGCFGVCRACELRGGPSGGPGCGVFAGVFHCLDWTAGTRKGDFPNRD